MLPLWQTLACAVATGAAASAPNATYLVFNRGDKIEALNQTVECYRIPSLVGYGALSSIKFQYI